MTVEPAFPRDALSKCDIPLYRFSRGDLEEAVASVPELELIGVDEFFIFMCEGQPSSSLGDLYWSIVANVLRDSIFGDRAKDDHVAAMMSILEEELMEVIASQFPDGRGAFVPYISLQVKRKKREVLAKRGRSSRGRH